MEAISFFKSLTGKTALHARLALVADEHQHAPGTRFIESLQALAVHLQFDSGLGLGRQLRVAADLVQDLQFVDELIVARKGYRQGGLRGGGSGPLGQDQRRRGQQQAKTVKFRSGFFTSIVSLFKRVGQDGPFTAPDAATNHQLLSVPLRSGVG